MKKEKWNELVNCVRLLKYGMSAKLCLGLMLLFVGIGIAFEMMIVLGAGGRFLNRVLDFGALFLYSAAMYPVQMLITLDLSGMVQASPYKRRIQTSAMSLLSLGCNLVVLAILLLIRFLGVCLAPERGAWIWSSLPAVGIMGMALSIMTTLMYKFYIFSMVVICVVCGTLGSISAYQGSMGITAGIPAKVVPFPVAAASCIAMILLGNAIQYLLTRALYKRPYSKGVFGSAVGKKFI